MMQTALFAGTDDGGAVLSPCERYRYRLWRGPEPRVALWVMLNPSTAGPVLDDATIRKVRGFSRRAGGGFEVVNLFALRATDPRELLRADEPVGPENRRHLFEAVQEAQARGAGIVVAWGALHPKLAQLAAPESDWLRSLPCRCLGTTKDGHPRHPLMVPYSVLPNLAWP